MRVLVLSLLVTLGASAAERGGRRSLLSPEHGASTTTTTMQWCKGDHCAEKEEKVEGASTTTTMAPGKAAGASTTTTMAPRKVPDRLYKPIDSFGSKVELHSDQEKAEKKSKDAEKAEEGGKAAEDVEAKEGGKAAEKSEEGAKKSEAEKSEEGATAEGKEAEGKEAEKSEDKEGEESGAKKSEEGAKAEGKEAEAEKSEADAEPAEPITTPSPADTVPPAPAPKYAVGPERQYDESEYADDWHTEWAHGDFPSYKETHNAAAKIEQYEDRQSDGKASPPGGMYAEKKKKNEKGSK